MLPISSAATATTAAPARKVIIIVLPPLVSVVLIHPFIIDDRATVHNIILFGVLQDHELARLLAATTTARCRCCSCCCRAVAAAHLGMLLLSSCALWTLFLWLLLSFHGLYRTKTHYCYDK